MKKPETPKGMKWQEAIEFLIRLAVIEDPEKLRPGDHLNLVDDLRRYFEIEGNGKLAREVAEAERKPGKLNAMIKVIRKLADAAADGKRIELTPKEKIIIVFDGSRLGDERGALSSDGRLEDVMADMAAADLDDAEAWQVRRCKECKEIFLAGRKGQIFCKHACANAAASRGYRAGHAKERAQRERKRYLQKKLGDAEPSNEV